MSNRNKLHIVKRQLRFVTGLAVLASLLFVWLLVEPEFSFLEPNPKELSIELNENDIENGIHVRTGFIYDEGMETVINNCTSCHSSKLVIQNRMDRNSWNATIEWMQEKQNLWDLGENQEVIVNYLVKNYPPVEKGRRENLANVDWYELK